MAALDENACANCLDIIDSKGLNGYVLMSTAVEIENGSSCQMIQLVTATFLTDGSIPLDLKLCDTCAWNVIDCYKLRRRFESSSKPGSPLSSYIRECPRIVSLNVKPNVKVNTTPVPSTSTSSPSVNNSEQSSWKDYNSRARRPKLPIVQVRVERLNLNILDLPERQIDKLKSQLSDLSLRRRSKRKRKCFLPSDIGSADEENDSSDEGELSDDGGNGHDGDDDFQVQESEDDGDFSDMDSGDSGPKTPIDKRNGEHAVNVRKEPYKCDENDCNAIFKRQKDWKNHLTSVHGITKYWKCPVCEKRLSFRQKHYHLRMHKNKDPSLEIKFRTRKTGREYKCSEENCGQVFNLRSDWVGHLKSAHGTIPLWQCPVCDKKVCFRTKKTHANAHKKDKDRDASSLSAGSCFQRVTATIMNNVEAEAAGPGCYEPNVRTMYKCMYPGCEQLFKLKELVSNHIRQCHLKYSLIMECYVCEHTLDTFGGLKRHFQFKHPEHTLVYCSSCRMTFPDEAGLKNHTCKIATEDEGFNPLKCCDVNCKETFRVLGHLQEHIRTEHPDTGHIHEVSNEEGTGTSSDTRNVIIRRPEDRLCPICRMYFQNKERFEKHFQLEHGGDLMNPRQFKCGTVLNNCDQVFASRIRLENHVRLIHNSIPMICVGCATSFPDESSLSSHACANPGHESNQIATQALTKRRRGPKAQLEKPLLCTYPDCSAKFALRISLQRHINYIHLGKARPYMCELCGKAYVNKFKLRLHGLSSHGTQAHCPKCPAKFAGMKLLKNHLKTHEDPKYLDYPCPFCPMTFEVSQRLERHVVTHNNTDTFECPICKNCFKHTRTLYRHLKHSHPGEEGKRAKEQFKSQKS